MTRLIAVVCLLMTPGVSNADDTGAAPAKPAAAKEFHFNSAKEAYDDMTQIFGFVPQLFKAYPSTSIAGAWAEYKSVFLNQGTVVPGKMKELIGLAVAAQIPCKYCSYAHQKFAQVNGATENESLEAVALSAEIRQWGTLFGALHLDRKAFQRDADRMLRGLQKARTQEAGTVPDDPIRGMNSNIIAHRDMKATFGFVPGFFEKIPAASQAAAWDNFKGLYMTTNALSLKNRDLIGVAVSSQSGCAECFYFSSKSAKMNGASETEVAEAISIASLTRKWSTVANGMQLDDTRFKSEIDLIVTRFSTPPPSKQMSGEAPGGEEETAQ